MYFSKNFASWYDSILSPTFFHFQSFLVLMFEGSLRLPLTCDAPSSLASALSSSPLASSLFCRFHYQHEVPTQFPGASGCLTLSSSFISFIIFHWLKSCRQLIHFGSLLNSAGQGVAEEEELAGKLSVDVFGDLISEKLAFEVVGASEGACAWQCAESSNSEFSWPSACWSCRHWCSLNSSRMCSIISGIGLTKHRPFVLTMTDEF